ncbi:MAG: aliphatic sulfonate ABC transporter substrate-binding protein [Acetobacteraceae bacterium]|nr:aliphatic sulfonate ABC transporter substrate-binding protein [Acetobacteraceae bacterium]
MVTRRSLLAALPALCVATAGARAAPDKTLRVGFQKGEPILLAARENRTLEIALAPLGIDVQWLEFQFGPPMLEAMRIGSIDIGGVGDTPPVFAQAAHSDLVYIAAQHAGGQAILVPPGSTLQTLQDLKGKRLAFGRGSSAHDLAVAALEKAGLGYDEIKPTYLAPADAAAAFERGAIDAWAVWDPYYALFEARPGVRVLAKWTDIEPQNSFFMARRAYVEANPAIAVKIVAGFVEVSVWARSHRPELAERLAKATGIPLDALQRAVDRVPFEVVTMDAAVTAAQQKVADRFHRIGEIPEAIHVADAVWQPPA